MRRGHFWIRGELQSTPGGTVQRGQMFVEWLAPATVTRAIPVILVHGGGGQGTDWLGTPDGRPGWAIRLVEAGFPVYVVDRPGFGRSPYNPDLLGDHTQQTTSEMVARLFASASGNALGERWPWGRTPGDEELEQLAAGMSFFLADSVTSQQLDGQRIAELLDLVGPAILITTSAGAPGGWIALNTRPHLVAALLAIEPMGPPYSETPFGVRLEWGLTSAPLTTTPPSATAAEAQGRAIDGFDQAPIGILVGTSERANAALPATLEFLAGAGADASPIRLIEHGIDGNGHGLMFEINSDETLGPVLLWLDEHLAGTPGVEPG